MKNSQRLHEKAQELIAQAEFYAQSGNEKEARELFIHAARIADRVAKMYIQSTDTNTKFQMYKVAAKYAIYAKKLATAREWIARAEHLQIASTYRTELVALKQSMPEGVGTGAALPGCAYFECKVQYEKENQTTGETDTVTEPYLIDAVSFSEAEQNIVKALHDKVKGFYDVKSISRSNITEVYEYEAGDYWHKCKVTYTDIEETGKESKSNINLLVNADNPKEAYERITEALNEMVVPFYITSSAITPIVGVFSRFIEQNQTR